MTSPRSCGSPSGRVPARDRPHVRLRRGGRGAPLRRHRPQARATSCSGSPDTSGSTEITPARLPRPPPVARRRLRKWRHRPAPHWSSSVTRRRRPSTRSSGSPTYARRPSPAHPTTRWLAGRLRPRAPYVVHDHDPLGHVAAAWVEFFDDQSTFGVLELEIERAVEAAERHAMSVPDYYVVLHPEDAAHHVEALVARRARERVADARHPVARRRRLARAAAASAADRSGLARRRVVAAARRGRRARPGRAARGSG